MDSRSSGEGTADPRLAAVGVASGARFFPFFEGGPPPAALEGLYEIPTTTSTSDPRQAHRVQLCAPDCAPTPIRRSSGAQREMKPASRAAGSAT